jgi:hypothetical protein
MAYNSDNHKTKVAFVMNIYREWKLRREDIPDTRFVKSELPKFGFKMSYTGFMNGYKHYGKNRNKGDRSQLGLF